MLTYRSDTSAEIHRVSECIGSGDASRHGMRSPVLERAILGMLHESPMHGYELRKQLGTKLGAIRAAISYGSLYPTLRRWPAAGLTTEGTVAATATGAEVPALTSKRSRVVYKITAEGKERFQE